MTVSDLLEETIKQTNDEILEAFNKAQDVNETVWYGPGTTLYDEVCRIVSKEIVKYHFRQKE